MISLTRFSPRRLLAFIRRMSPLDRAAIIVLVLSVLARIDTAMGRVLPLTRVLNILGIVAMAYLLLRMLPWLRSKLLWSLRNRLIVASVFMAIVPALLLLAMAGVAFYLLELQIGAHLFRDDLQSHLTLVVADRDAIAAAVNREMELKIDPAVPQNPPNNNDPVLSRPNVAALIAAEKVQWPALRVLLNPQGAQKLVRSGNGPHFAGLSELGGNLYFASVEELHDGRTNLIVGAPVTTALLDSLPSKLGSIQLTLLGPAPDGSGGMLLDGRRYIPRERVTSSTRVLAPATNWFDIQINGIATLEAFRVDAGPDAAELPVLAQFSFRISQVGRDLLTSVGDIGPILVDALIIAGVIFLLLEIGAITTGFVMTRTITRSVASLYDATLHVRRGDFNHRVQVPLRDQLGALGESFNEMTASIAELIEERSVKQNLEHEISIAREVQQQLFPHSFPSVPGLELAAICRPARVVSGDYYDFIPLGPSRVGIALADISGKGIYAAVLMASVQAALHSIAMLNGHGNTSELVSLVNRHLFQNTSDDRYATLFYAVYDSETKTLTYTNAGHLPPFFITGETVQELDRGGTVVGLFADSRYEQGTIQVPPGSLLVAFSDGLTEPENVSGEEFGTERLKSEALRYRGSTPAEVANKLIEIAERWTAGADPADDMTIVVARMG